MEFRCYVQNKHNQKMWQLQNTLSDIIILDNTFYLCIAIYNSACMENAKKCTCNFKVSVFMYTFW